MNNAPIQDPVSSVPPLSLRRTPAEQALHTAFLVRILSQVTMAVSYIMCAMAWKCAGDSEAAAVQVRKALDWLDRITEELHAEKRRDDARVARLQAEHAAACAAAEAAAAARAAAEAATAADAAEQSLAAVIPMPVRAGVKRNNDILWMPSLARSFGPRAACAAFAAPRFGGWCAPPRGPRGDRLSKPGFAAGVYVCP